MKNANMTSLCKFASQRISRFQINPNVGRSRWFCSDTKIFNFISGDCGSDTTDIKQKKRWGIQINRPNEPQAWDGKTPRGNEVINFKEHALHVIKEWNNSIPQIQQIMPERFLVEFPIGVNNNEFESKLGNWDPTVSDVLNDYVNQEIKSKYNDVTFYFIKLINAVIIDILYSVYKIYPSMVSDDDTIDNINNVVIKPEYYTYVAAVVYVQIFGDLMNQLWHKYHSIHVLNESEEKIQDDFDTRLKSIISSMDHNSHIRASVMTTKLRLESLDESSNFIHQLRQYGDEIEGNDSSNVDNKEGLDPLGLGLRHPVCVFTALSKYCAEYMEDFAKCIEHFGRYQNEQEFLGSAKIMLIHINHENVDDIYQFTKNWKCGELCGNADSYSKETDFMGSG